MYQAKCVSRIRPPDGSLDVAMAIKSFRSQSHFYYQLFLRCLSPAHSANRDKMPRKTRETCYRKFIHCTQHQDTKDRCFLQEEKREKYLNVRFVSSLREDRKKQKRNTKRKSFGSVWNYFYVALREN